MTRRQFSIRLTGTLASSAIPASPASGNKSVILTAIAGARLPETLTVTIDWPRNMRDGIWELRTYRRTARGLADSLVQIFPRAGIRPLFSESAGGNVAYLIPFENLAARERAWTLLNADPLWISARAGFASYGFGLYRVL